MSEPDKTKRFLRAARFVLWWLVLAAGAGFLALSLDKAAPPALKQDAGKGVQLSPAPGFAMADFLLTTHEGKALTLDDLKGKAVIIFFGFTHCPMICPTELADITRWLEALGPEADAIRALFVTVDPERDSVMKMNSYVQPFQPYITGLTGTPEQTEKMAKDYFIFYKKVPVEGGYIMDHSASTYLFDKSHTFVGTIDSSEKDETAIGKLKLLVKR